MVKLKVFCNHYFPWLVLLLLSTNCNLPRKHISAITLNASELPAWIETSDLLSFQNPVVYKNGERHILVNSVQSIRHILSHSGCMNGYTSVRLHSHEIIGNTDVWTIVCQKKEISVYENVHFFFPSGKTQSYYPELDKKMEVAEKAFKQARGDNLFREILQKEPGLPLPRLRLALLSLRSNNCKTARLHFSVYLKIAPASPFKNQILKLMKSKCNLS